MTACLRLRRRKKFFRQNEEARKRAREAKANEQRGKDVPDGPSGDETELKDDTEELDSPDLLFSEVDNTEDLNRENILNGIDFAMDFINNEEKDFISYARFMVEELGNGIRPYLVSIYSALRAMPGVDSEGMDPDLEVQEIWRRNEEARQRAREAQANEQRGKDVHDGPSGHGTDSPGHDRPGETGVSGPGPSGTWERGPGGSAVNEPGLGTGTSGSTGPGDGTGEPGGNAGVRDGTTPGLSGETDPDGMGQPGRSGGDQQPVRRNISYVGQPDALQEGRTQIKKAQDNLAAVELIKKLRQEQRPATAEEQQQLSLYVGWGGLAGVFPDANGKYSNPTFTNKLRQAWATQNSLLCVGLDPDPSRFSSSLRSTDPILDFCHTIIDATAPYVCAFKIQIAFFAAQRAEKVLEQVVKYIRERHPQIPVILDAKRGDIGTTARMYAQEAFERYEADAVTVNPFLGGDTLEPFLEYRDRGVIILCRTSNPGSGEIQGIQTQEQTVSLKIAHRAMEDWNRHGNVSLVVGATWTEELRAIRSVVGSMPLLVPGIGAQGGNLQKVIAVGMDPNGQGLVINASRSILYASAGSDYAMAAATEAAALCRQINHFRETMLRERGVP